MPIPLILFHNVFDCTAQKWALERYQTLLQNSSELLISGSDDHTLFLWSLFSSSPVNTNTKKPTPLTRLNGHQRQISHVQFSPDGRWAASTSFDGSVRIWEGRTGKFVGTLRGHVGAVYRVTWSADSRMVVSASKDATLKVSHYTSTLLYVWSLEARFANIWSRYGIWKLVNSKWIYRDIPMKSIV